MLNLMIEKDGFFVEDFPVSNFVWKTQFFFHNKMLLRTCTFEVES